MDIPSDDYLVNIEYELVGHVILISAMRTESDLSAEFRNLSIQAVDCGKGKISQIIHNIGF